MTRNLKALGLAVMAAFALSAVGATAAQALTVDVGAGGKTITGEQIVRPEHKDHTFTLSSGRDITCTEARFDGTIENGATEITVTPTFITCYSNDTQPVTITHNGCNFRFYGGAGEGPDLLNKVTVDLDCPTGKEIEIHIYSSHHSHTTAQPILCTYNVHEFVGKHNNTLESTTTATPNQDDVDVTTTLEVVITRKTGSALVCGTESQTASFTAATTLRAYSNDEHTNQVDLSVTG